MDSSKEQASPEHAGWPDTRQLGQLLQLAGPSDALDSPGSPSSLYSPESLQGWTLATSDPISHPVTLPTEPQLAGAFNRK